VTVVSSPPPPVIEDLHRRLIAASPLALKLHCSSMLTSELADPSVRHVTFAQGRYFDRPVTRRELALSNRSLFGPPPSSLLPATSDTELFAFVRRDLREFLFRSPRDGPPGTPTSGWISACSPWHGRTSR